MKVASLATRRDGQLVLVSRDLKQATLAAPVASSLQLALDDWNDIAPELERRYARLNAGEDSEAFAFDPAACASPLPRAYQWVDGSAYVNHVELVRRARGAEMPERFWQAVPRRFPQARESIGLVQRGLNLASRLIENVDEVYPYLHCHWPDPGLVMASDFRSSPLNQETEARRLLNSPISRWQYLDCLLYTSPSPRDRG